MESVKPAAPPEAILQLKVRLLGVSPMIWRRVLVPESVSLRELHGVVQLAMGWEGIHLFEFAVRGVRYAGPGLSGTSTDVALLDFRFRRNARFRYVYDMFCDSGSTKFVSRNAWLRRPASAIRGVSAVRAPARRRTAAVPTLTTPAGRKRRDSTP